MEHRKNYRGKDITGQRFGMLVAIGLVEGTRTTWRFRCDCGNEVTLKISRVFHGQLSCGCMSLITKKKWAESHITHGESKTTLYRKYRSMIERCEKPSNWEYKRYGGRGITVCDEWRRSFSAFRNWAYSTGYDPNLDGRTEQSIDRIDNNGPYCPENCRWSTAYEQQKNREITKLYPFNESLYSASEFADKFGITDKSFVYRRLEKGQNLEYILNDWERIHNVPSGLIEVPDYANEHGVSSATVRRWINEGKVPGEKVGRKWYVKQ